MACWIPGCAAGRDGRALCREHWLLVPKPLRFEYEQAWSAARGFKLGLTARGYLALRDCIASAQILTGHKTVEEVIAERPIWVCNARDHEEARERRMRRARGAKPDDETEP